MSALVSQIDQAALNRGYGDRNYSVVGEWLRAQNPSRAEAANE